MASPDANWDRERWYYFETPRCPECSKEVMLADAIRGYGLYECPHCNVELLPKERFRSFYALMGYLLGFYIAHTQGLHSLFLFLGGTFYGLFLMILLMGMPWELPLPKRYVTKPKLNLW